MNDVAREAGVALRTVSRYVNGETNIDPTLVERIRDAITSLGYRRNLAAASIRPGWTSKMLALVIGDLANPYYSSIARAVEERVRSEGYLLTTVSSDEDGARHDQLVDRLMEQRIDGMIIVPPRAQTRDWDTIPPPVPPVVFVDRPGAFPSADCILADNDGGAAEAVSFLLEKGTRRIAFVGDGLDIFTIRERHKGYLSAHRAAGVEPDLESVFTSAHTSEQAADIVRRVVETESADAIFAANNRAAVGALMAFRSLGRRLPMIGFDDFEAAVLSTPATSVVTQDIAAMGTLAADTLLARLAGDASPARTVVLPTRLILRGSEAA
nr:LacI family DNA-binding transcriptional regulator [Agromyces marinus]